MSYPSRFLYLVLNLVYGASIGAATVLCLHQDDAWTDRPSTALREGSRPRRSSTTWKCGSERRTTASGDVSFEIDYRDREGRRRWKTVAGDLEDAKRERDELWSVVA